MGGEPTFVSIDDREGGEWNTEAMGPTKRALSGELMERLRAQLRRRRPASTSARASGIRASSCRAGRSTCFWRKDGVPIWHDPALIASERDDHGATAGAGARVPASPRARASASTAATSSPATRTLGYYLWRERKLPINVEPIDSRLADKAERARLRRVFERGLGKPVGYALPLARDERHPARWRSTPWFLRDDHCFLVAGDSPIGFRLPLDSLPWARAGDCPWVYPPDANDDLPPLDVAAAGATDEPAWHASGEPPSRARPSTRRRAARTTSAASPRRRRRATRRAGRVGRLRRPHRDLRRGARRPALHLHAADVGARGLPRRSSRAVEATAQAMRLPVMLEGYEPPKDPRLDAAARHARPGRDRGQRPSGVELGRARRADDASSTTRRARRA